MFQLRNGSKGNSQSGRQETAAGPVLSAQGEKTISHADGQRFAHNATSSKVETPVRFPSHLDMRPYVKESDLPNELYQYDLFAVVTHEGKLDNGHYWADVLSGNEWWHCDDDKGE